MPNQRTIQSVVRTTGIGVHSARKATLTLRPAPADHGIRFSRTDVDGCVDIPALADFVTQTLLSTSLGRDGVEIGTVEHLLSAAAGLGIDNLRVEVHGPEVPSMDGSAAPFVYLLQSAGITELPAPKRFLCITSDVTVRKGPARACLRPYPGFRAGYRLVVDHPVYNRLPKHRVLDFGAVSYVKEVSRARSFGLLRDLEQAHRLNRCLGSSLDNAVGIDDYRVLNTEGLRYDDEFVRHKLLDAIGDLMLLGYPVIGAFSGVRSGHALNTRLAAAVLANRAAWTLVSESGPSTEPAYPFTEPVSTAA